MIYDIFQILLWITAIMLFISGVDDLYLDLLYWFEKGNYKRKLPDFSEMFEKPEKPIAVFIGAWKESGVIGRTLSYAVKNLKYENYRFFLGVYPNDPETLKVVQEVSQKDSRVIPCVNNVNGPTTKADNLNLLYAGLIEYEKQYGKFEIILVHDAEDFIHPFSLKLYNLLLGYKGYHAIQIPVMPIKSKLGKLFHRTYCDAFAEVHTKDMIVRQAMGTFIPFAGTGMGFHRKTFNFLEKHYHENINGKNKENNYVDPFNTNYQPDFSLSDKDVSFSEEDLVFQNDETHKDAIHVNKTRYQDDPFKTLNPKNGESNRSVKDYLRSYTFMFMAIIIGWISFLVYTGKTESNDSMFASSDLMNNLSFSPSDAIAKSNISGELSAKYDLSESGIPIDEIVSVSNGFSDIKYNVLYTESGINKFSIIESTWSNELSAGKRVNELKYSGILSGKSVSVKLSILDGKNIYRVIISDYDKLIDARRDISKLKEPVKQITKNY